MQSGRSERQHRPASQLSHECRSAGRTMDATDTAAPETRYCGRSQALLYNTIRPHASIGYKPPAPEVFVPAFAAWPAALADRLRRPAQRGANLYSRQLLCARLALLAQLRTSI